MTKVEFRLLQVILSPVSGDKVTLALLHWDGTRLRVASSMLPLVACDPDHRDGIRVAAEDIVRHAERASARVTREPLLDVGLAHVFPVREGLGAALYWSPVASLRTENADAHFAELRRELRLDRERASNPKRISAKRVHQYLVQLGETLKLEEPLGAWVRTEHEVHARLPYSVPLSWKNAGWHRALPLSFFGAGRSEMDRTVEQLYGLIELAIPTGDIPVLVPVMPVETRWISEAHRELRLLVDAFSASRNLEILAPEWRDDSLSYDALIARVRSDVTGHAGNS